MQSERRELRYAAPCPSVAAETSREQQSPCGHQRPSLYAGKADWRTGKLQLGKTTARHRGCSVIWERANIACWRTAYCLRSRVSHTEAEAGVQGRGTNGMAFLVVQLPACRWAED